MDDMNWTGRSFAGGKSDPVSSTEAGWSSDSEDDWSSDNGRESRKKRLAYPGWPAIETHCIEWQRQLKEMIGKTGSIVSFSQAMRCSRQLKNCHGAACMPTNACCTLPGMRFASIFRYARMGAAREGSTPRKSLSLVANCTRSK